MRSLVHGNKSTLMPTFSRRPRAKPSAFSLELQCAALKIPAPVREFRFHSARRWKFDYAWPDLKIAVEQEGITYKRGDYRAGGRHTSISGFTKDLEKYNAATAAGWRVLRFLPGQIANGQAAGMVFATMAEIGRKQAT